MFTQESAVKLVRKYLGALPRWGIHARRAVLFGSSARGEAHENSDIDVVVIASELDRPHTIDDVEQLWRATRDGDDRIEPIPCGEQEWERGTDRPIIEIARQEGIMVSLSADQE